MKIFYGKVVRGGGDEQPIYHKDPSGTLKFSGMELPTPLAAISYVSHNVANPFDDGTIYSLASPYARVPEKRPSMTIEDLSEYFDLVIVMFNHAKNSLQKGDEEEIAKAMKAFKAAKENLYSAIFCCVDQGNAEPITKFAKDILDAINGVEESCVLVQAHELVSIAYFGLSEICRLKIEAEPLKTLFDDYLNCRSGEHGRYFKSEIEVRQFRTNVVNPNYNPDNESDEWRRKAAIAYRELHLVEQKVGDLGSKLAVLADRAMGKVIPDSRELGLGEIGIVEKGYGIGFSSLGEEVALVLVAPDGTKLGISYTDKHSPDFLEKAYALLVQKCPDLSPRQIKAYIVGGAANKKIHEIAGDSTNYNLLPEKLEEKLGVSGRLVSEVLQFLRTGGMNIEAACIFEPNTPAAFVVTDTGLHAGRSSKVNPNSVLRKTLLCFGVIDHSIMNIAFRKYSDPYNPVVFSPHFPSKKDGNGSMPDIVPFVGRINQLMAMVEFHFLADDLFRDGVDVSAIATVCHAFGGCNSMIDKVIKTHLCSLLGAVTSEPSITLSQESSGQTTAVIAVKKGNMPKKITVPNANEALLFPLQLELRLLGYPLAIGEGSQEFNEVIGYFLKGGKIVASAGKPFHIKRDPESDQITLELNRSGCQQRSGVACKQIAAVTLGELPTELQELLNARFEKKTGSRSR